MFKNLKQLDDSFFTNLRSDNKPNLRGDLGELTFGILMAEKFKKMKSQPKGRYTFPDFEIIKDYFVEVFYMKSDISWCDGEYIAKEDRTPTLLFRRFKKKLDCYNKSGISTPITLVCVTYNNYISPIILAQAGLGKTELILSIDQLTSEIVKQEQVLHRDGLFGYLSESLNNKHKIRELITIEFHKDVDESHGHFELFRMSNPYVDYESLLDFIPDVIDRKQKTTKVETEPLCLKNKNLVKYYERMWGVYVSKTRK